MTITPIFRWFDLYVGVYIDTKKYRVYIFPIPCIGVCIQLKGSEMNDGMSPFWLTVTIVLWAIAGALGASAVIQSIISAVRKRRSRNRLVIGNWPRSLADECLGLYERSAKNSLPLPTFPRYCRVCGAALNASYVAGEEQYNSMTGKIDSQLIYLTCPNKPGLFAANHRAHTECDVRLPVCPESIAVLDSFNLSRRQKP